MWRELLAVLLIGITAQAQTQANQADLPSKPAPKPVPRVEAYQRLSQLRRGTTEEVGVVLVVNELLTSVRSPSTGIVPVTLTLDAEPGLSYSKITYPKPSQTKFKVNGNETPVHWGWFPIEMKLTADKNAALGPHTIHGKLKYQPVTKEGALPLQEMDVVLPVNVVEHYAQVSKNREWPFYHMPAGEIVGLTILCIVLLPILIPLMAICIPTGRCAD